LILEGNDPHTYVNVWSETRSRILALCVPCGFGLGSRLCRPECHPL